MTVEPTENVQQSFSARCKRRSCQRRNLWIRTSQQKLEFAETQLLKVVKNVKMESTFVPISFRDSFLYTVTVRPTECEPGYGQKIPLVLVHGFGGGIGLWMHNLEALSANRPVFAFDLLGFGRSSRPKFSSDADTVESEWVSSFEDWRKEMKIDNMILVGHSLGGYLSCVYAIKHAERIEHLILADPWGFPPKPPQEVINQIPLRYRVFGRIAIMFNPLSGVRAAGPWGRRLVERMRPDLGNRYAVDSHEGHKDAFFDYLYHSNAQKPSGEAAYKKLTTSLVWAQRPMIQRLLQLHSDVPISFIYGSETWIERTSGEKKSGYLLKERAGTERVINVEEIDGAGHHVYADAPEVFNMIVNRICANIY